MTPAELAKRSGLTPAGIRDGIRRGGLPATAVQSRYGWEWKIDRADADAWIRTHKPQPRHDHRQIAEMARRGARVDEITAVVGCSRRTVFRVLNMPISKL